MMSAKTYLKRKKPITSTRTGRRLFFVMFSSRCVCLIRHANISLPKKGNLERHFTITYNKYTKDFPVQSELRKKS